MNFVKLIQILVDAGVKFVIIGGWSAILHGSSHTTRDLDLCFARNRANLQKIATALAPFHPTLRDLPPGLPFVWDETKLRNGTLFTLSTDLGSGDLLGEVLGIGSFEQAKEVSVEVDAFDRRIWTLNLSALDQGKKSCWPRKGFANSAGASGIA